MVVLGRDGSIQGFAPQALGERVPQITNGYFYADTGIQLLGHFEEYAKLYRCQPVVATLVDKIANSAARLDIKVYDTTDPKGRKELPDSDFAKLLAAPSRTMSAFSFYRWTFSTYEVYGEAFWLKVRDKTGSVVTLEPMHPERVSIKRDLDGTVSYIFSIGVASTGILTAPAEDVVAFQRYNPDNTMRGLSRLEQLRVTLLNEDAARRANSAFWKNGARPSVVISHPDSLSRDAMDKIKGQFDARHSGADNFGGSVVLEEGMTITETQLDAEEMQYIEGRKLNMQEACMVFDVPPPVVHILDHATYSNITEQMRSMYRDTMSPRLEDFESVIDFALRTEFYPDGGFEAEFDMTDILRGDFETRATTAAALRQGGIVTGNEARDIIGMEQSDDPEMAKVFANSAMVELGTKPPAPGGGGGDDGGDATVPGDELLTGGKPKPKPGSVPGDELLKPKPVIGKPSPAAKSIERAILGEAGRAIKAGKLPSELKQMLVDQHIKALDPYFRDQRGAALRGEFGPKAPARKGLLRVDTKDTALNDADASDNIGGTDVFDDADSGDDSDTYTWDSRLSDLLGALSKSTAAAIGRMVSNELGASDPYDASDIADMLTVEAGKSAVRINAATYAQLADALAKAIQDSDDSDDDADFYARPEAVESVYDKLLRTDAEGEGGSRLDTLAESRVSQVGLTAGLGAAAYMGLRTKTWQVNSPHPRPAHAMVDGETQFVGQFFSNGMLGPGDIANGGIDEVAGCDCTLSYDEGDSTPDYTDVLEKSLGLKYSPDQPREHGRFAPGDSSDGGGDDEQIPAARIFSTPLGSLGYPAALAAKAIAEAPAGEAIATAALKGTTFVDGPADGGSGLQGVKGSFEASTNTITVDPNVTGDVSATAETLTHEIGHAIDYRMGSNGMAASAEHQGDPKGTAWGDYWHGVRDSASASAWNGQYGARMAAYAHTPTEVFARSYAQYTGLAQPGQAGQFSSSDFGKISPSMTRILKGES